MGSDAAEQFGNIPMSAKLAQSLMRAADYAREMSHVEIRLEHLLLSLTEDDDALSILHSSRVDIARLQSDVSSHLGALSERQPEGGPATTNVAEPLKRILEAASAAAKGRRSEINGAIVLAAIVGEGNNAAAHILSGQGLTFEATIHALQQMADQPSGAPPEQARAPTSPAAGNPPAGQPQRPGHGGSGGQPVQAGQVPMNASPHADAESNRGSRGEAPTPPPAIASHAQATPSPAQTGEAGAASGQGVESILEQARQSIRERSGQQTSKRSASSPVTQPASRDNATDTNRTGAPPVSAPPDAQQAETVAEVSAARTLTAPVPETAAPKSDNAPGSIAHPTNPADAAPLGEENRENREAAREKEPQVAEKGLASLQTASQRATPPKAPLAEPPPPAPPSPAPSRTDYPAQPADRSLSANRTDNPEAATDAALSSSAVDSDHPGHPTGPAADRPEARPSVHGSYRLPESPRQIGDGRPVSPRPKPFPRLPERTPPQRPDIPGRGLSHHVTGQSAGTSGQPATHKPADTVPPAPPPHQPQSRAAYAGDTGNTHAPAHAYPKTAGPHQQRRPEMAAAASNLPGLERPAANPPTTQGMPPGHPSQSVRIPGAPNRQPGANLPPHPPAPPPDPATGQPFRPAIPPGYKGHPVPPAGPRHVESPASNAEAQGLARPTIALELCNPEDLLEAIPVRMRSGKPTPVELRLRPGQLLALADADAGRPASLTLRLRAPGGDAVVETVSGETQWANIQRTGSGEDHIVWRWTVTPKSYGRKPLKIAIVARTVGTDALMIEHTLPSQIKEVRIAPNYAAFLSASLKSLAAFALGAGAVLFAEPIWLYVGGTLEILGLR